MDINSTCVSDIWSEWLLRDRHGGDPKLEQSIRREVDQIADRVLDAAGLRSGMTLADIGTGDGVVGFRAIERVGPTLQVLFADISAPLLHHARALASQKNVLGQCRFLEASADNLGAIDDESVDVVTTRAVLAYVQDKPAALREFYRILRPGGQLSIAEPILQDHALNAIALRRLVESQTDTKDQVLSLVHRWKAAQFPDTLDKLAESPIANYSEQDLLATVVNSGFVKADMKVKAHARNTEGVPWQTFLNSSPHPLAPTLGVVLRDKFSPDEQRLFERTIRATIEAGSPAADERVIYLSARKPIE